MTALSSFATTRRNRFARQGLVRRGFTLVEILIVVIILGILAAIVIPQFTNASQDARKSNVVSQLQTLRAQIELYKLQHKDAIPLLMTGGAAPWDVFLKYTDINGGVNATKTGNFIGAVKIMTVKKRARPSFVDRCLPPGAKKPAKC